MLLKGAQLAKIVEHSSEEEGRRGTKEGCGKSEAEVGQETRGGAGNQRRSRKPDAEQETGSGTGNRKWNRRPEMRAPRTPHSTPPLRELFRRFFSGRGHPLDELGQQVQLRRVVPLGDHVEPRVHAGEVPEELGVARLRIP